MPALRLAQSRTDEALFFAKRLMEELPTIRSEPSNRCSVDRDGPAIDDADILASKRLEAITGQSCPSPEFHEKAMPSRSIRRKSSKPECRMQRARSPEVEVAALMP